MVRQTRETRGLEAGRMRYHAAAWVAWSVCVMSVALLALAGLFIYLTPPIPRAEPQAVFIVLFVVLSLTYPTVGALIASRRPRNPIGWIFCAAGLLIVGTGYATAHANYSVFARPEPLPATQYAAWFASSGILVYAVLLISALLLLLYPDGRLLSRGWQVALWAVVIGCATWALAWTTGPGPLSYPYRSIDNPLVIEGSVKTVLVDLSSVSILLAFFGWVAAAISWVYRWDLAEGEERQQIKWFAYSFLLIVVSLVYPWYLTPFALAFLPVATGIAILRHRLYDIDILINRTLVYGSLTATLVIIYLGGVTATQAIIQRITGQERLPQLIIVASTLVIAALFSPLRRRIQSFIDRLFYRRRYDAKETLEAFSARLRDQTDLEAVNDDLVGVVRETVQPAHVSLWMRTDKA